MVNKQTKIYQQPNNNKGKQQCFRKRKKRCLHKRKQRYLNLWRFREG